MQYTVSLKQNHIFRRLYKKGKKQVTPSLAVYAARNGGRTNRLGLTTSTKLGCAVVRNRVRRRLREIYRGHEAELRRGYDIVIVARVRAVYTGYSDLERSFLKAAGGLGLLTAGGGRK
ncbi:MAG: ribonuclease P protein component [Oscillospiraceae bacterium]|nr:ribonuclease P protein component [Oscillospiraceae bacterium]